MKISKIKAQNITQIKKYIKRNHIGKALAIIGSCGLLTAACQKYEETPAPTEKSQKEINIEIDSTNNNSYHFNIYI